MVRQLQVSWESVLATQFPVGINATFAAQNDSDSDNSDSDSDSDEEAGDAYPPQPLPGTYV